MFMKKQHPYKGRSTIKAISKCWQLYVLMLPALIYIILFEYKPMYGILIAFTDYNLRRGVWGSEWVGFEHFTRLFNSYWFPVILKNTLTHYYLSLLV